METEVYDVVQAWTVEAGDQIRYEGQEFLVVGIDRDDPDEENFLVFTLEGLDNIESDDYSIYEFDEIELIN